MKFRFYLSLLIAKLAYAFLKITKLSSGTAIIGLITLKICPEFLTFANNSVSKSKVNITGTNGKTTSTGIISHLVSEEKHTLMNNTLGANMLNGIINALALQICPLKKKEYSVIETDEAFLAKVYSKMRGDFLLVTNLFEDQTDRFPSPIITKNLIQKGIDLSSDVQLILNADEPISASLTSSKTPIFYGINNIFDENKHCVQNSFSEFTCPMCGEKLAYSKQFYSQIGHYNCACGYIRPEVKYCADVILHKDFSVLILDGNEYKIPLAGLFNAYNALGAISLAKELGIDNIKKNIETFKVAFGRSERRILNGHKTLIQLIKNPAGTNEVLKTVDLDSTILIAANNNIADGTDISWINQANFEKLAEVKNEIVTTGKCSVEVAERLRVAGIDKIKNISDIAQAVKYVGLNAKNDITILTTYTALLKIDKIKEIKKCC